MKNNKKGFTLIELLAVIVILAILVMLAIPAVTRYLTTARMNTFSDNALRAVEAVRNDVVSAGFDSTDALSGAKDRVCTGAKCTYNYSALNQLLENKLGNSSFGNTFERVGDSSKACALIVVEPASDNSGNYTYTVTMVDAGGNGFIGKEVGQINASPEVIKTDGSLNGTSACTGS